MADFVLPVRRSACKSSKAQAYPSPLIKEDSRPKRNPEAWRTQDSGTNTWKEEQKHLFHHTLFQNGFCYPAGSQADSSIDHQRSTTFIRPYWSTSTCTLNYLSEAWRPLITSWRGSKTKTSFSPPARPKHQLAILLANVFISYKERHMMSEKKEMSRSKTSHKKTLGVQHTNDSMAV